MRDLGTIIVGLNNGGFVADCNQRLEEVLKACDETGGVGQITVALKIVRNDDGTAQILPNVSIKKPTRKRGASLFYLHNGELFKEDPRQMKLTGNNIRNLEPKLGAVKEL